MPRLYQTTLRNAVEERGARVVTVVLVKCRSKWLLDHSDSPVEPYVAVHPAGEPLTTSPIPASRTCPRAPREPGALAAMPAGLTRKSFVRLLLMSGRRERGGALQAQRPGASAQGSGAGIRIGLAATRPCVDTAKPSKEESESER